MKELIQKLAIHAGYLERYRSGDQRAMAGDIRAAIAALEAAESREAELRARVAELEGMVQKPFGPIKHPNACLVCGAIHGHGGLQCPSYLVSWECAL